MKNIKTRTKINYNYNLGDMIVKGSTSSNYIEPVFRQVLVKIKRTADAKYFKPGDIITYNLILTNEGNHSAEEVTVHENINHQTLVPGSVKLSTLADAQPFRFHHHENELEFIILNLQPFKTLYIQYQTKVDDIKELDYKLISSSVVTIDKEDTIISDPVEITEKFAKINCTIDEIDLIYPNKPYEYLLNIENVGNQVANDIEVETLLPDDYELDLVLVDDEEHDIYAVEDNVLKIMIEKLAGQSSLTVSIKGKIKRSWKRPFTILCYNSMLYKSLTQ